MELKTKHKIAFGIGALGKDIVYMLISSYLLYYYNAVLGINSAFIGTVMMAARVFDAFNDPFMGIVVAKTRTKWGKFRPWIFAGTILNAVTIYALFAAPKSDVSILKIWLVIFYLLWGITYTLMDIPFWSMIPAITNPGKDREQLSSIARSCSGIGDALPTILTMIIVPVLSGSAVIADYRIGFKWWALSIAIVFIICECICVFSVPEKKQPESVSSEGVTAMFKALFRNDQAMTVVVSVILVYTALNIVGNLILYFFQFDVCNVDAYSLFVAIAFAAQVLAMMFFPALRKKYSKQQLFLGGFIMQILGFIILFLMSVTNLYDSTTWLVLCLPGILVYAGYGTLNVLLTIFLSDSVDYGEFRNGTREESVIFSMQTFTVKLASGLAVFLAGIALDLIHMDTAAQTQSISTLTGLRMWMTIPSVILLIVGILVYRRFYKLDDQKLTEISQSLKLKS